MERVSIETREMGEIEISDIDEEGGASALRDETPESPVICPLVFITCIRCVIKSRETGDGHVRFSEQLRDEIPLG